MAPPRKYDGPCAAHSEHHPNCSHCDAIAAQRRRQFGERVIRKPRAEWSWQSPDKHTVPIYPGLHWSAP